MTEGWEGDVRTIDWGGYVYGMPAQSKEIITEDDDIQAGLNLIIALGYA